MKRNENETKARYAKFLKELYELSKIGPITVNAKDICFKHKINNNAFNQCFSIGILKRDLRDVRWNVGEPSLHMAEQLIEHCAKYQRAIKRAIRHGKQYDIENNLILENKPMAISESMILLGLERDVQRLIIEVEKLKTQPPKKSFFRMPKIHFHSPITFK